MWPKRKKLMISLLANIIRLSKGKEWKNYDGTKPKQYMRTYVVE